MINRAISIKLLCSITLAILVVASNIAMERQPNKPTFKPKKAVENSKSKQDLANERKKAEKKEKEKINKQAEIVLEQKKQHIKKASNYILSTEQDNKKSALETNKTAEEYAAKVFFDDLNNAFPSSATTSSRFISNEVINPSPTKLIAGNKSDKTSNRLDIVEVQRHGLGYNLAFYGEETTPTRYVYNNKNGEPLLSFDVSPSKTITRDKYGTPIKSIRSGSLPIGQAIAFNKAIREKDVNAIQALSRNSVLDNTYPSYILLKRLVSNKISKKEWQELELHPSMTTYGEPLAKQNFIEVADQLTHDDETREKLRILSVESPVKNNSSKK